MEEKWRNAPALLKKRAGYNNAPGEGSVDRVNACTTHDRLAATLFLLLSPDTRSNPKGPDPSRNRFHGLNCPGRSYNDSLSPVDVRG